MSRIFALLSMFFLHVLDDYTLQGWLANAKQKSWWEKNAPDKLYRFDWIMALAMHAMSWSFMVMLPIAAYFGFQVGLPFFLMWSANSILHGVIDDLKANRHKINLVVDQLLHILQIEITFLILMI